MNPCMSMVQATLREHLLLLPHGVDFCLVGANVFGLIEWVVWGNSLEQPFLQLLVIISTWACRNHVVTKDCPLRIQSERKVLGSNISFPYLWKASIVNGIFPVVMPAGQL